MRLVRVVGDEQGGVGAGSDHTAGGVLAQSGVTVGLCVKRDKSENRY